jgi:hypothetical protein
MYQASREPPQLVFDITHTSDQIKKRRMAPRLLEELGLEEDG